MANHQGLFGRRLSLVVVGFAVVIAFAYIRNGGTTGISKSKAQVNPSYTAVLAEIQQATTSQAI
jgi:hypothetical protein